MIILADLSGIQDYLFEVQEVGGKQAASLRARSLRIQIYAQVIAARLLRAANLTTERLVFCAAGKILIDAPGLPANRCDAVHQEAGRMEDSLFNETHGRLRLAWALHPGESEPPAVQLRKANEVLARKKLQAWRSTTGNWRDRLLVVPALLDPEQEARWDAALGRSALSAAHVGARHPQGALAPASDRVLDLELHVEAAHALATPETVWSAPLDGLARHVPLGPGNQLVEFVDLAQRSRGAAMLGVFKADADSLGQAVSRRLEGAIDLQALRTLAEQLDHFFGPRLGKEMSRADSPWHNLYTIFSGGDDLLIVGPWNTVLDFAGWFREFFTWQFRHPDGLTLSGGVAIVKPKFPIRLAAQQADDLLDQAKQEKSPGATQPKDQFAALGQFWKWQDHDGVLNAAKQLAAWVDAGVVQRGWLHTLLELTLWRRGESPDRVLQVQPPAIATSRLAYHIDHNWPSRDEKDPAKAAAHHWARTILDGFDAPVTKAPVKYLPAIVRYAMLATRSSDTGDAR